MDAGTKAVRTSDDGFIILAQTYSYGSGLADIWIVKIDSIGNKVWDKTFGNESTDLAHDIIQSNDGGYIIVGGTQSEKTKSQDAYIIKIDSLGNNIWERVYGGVEVDLFSSIASSSDGYGYMVVGHTSSYMLDKHPELIESFFGNYKRVIYLVQSSNSELTELAMGIADYLGLEFEERLTGYGDLERSLGQKIFATS